MNNLIEESQNKNSRLIISTSILDKKSLVNFALEDTSIYFPCPPVLRNLSALKALCRMDSIE